MGTSWIRLTSAGHIPKVADLNPPPLLPKPDPADKEVHGNNHDPSRAGFGFGSYSWTSGLERGINQRSIPRRSARPARPRRGTSVPVTTEASHKLCSPRRA